MVTSDVHGVNGLWKVQNANGKLLTPALHQVVWSQPWTCPRYSWVYFELGQAGVIHKKGS